MAVGKALGRVAVTLLGIVLALVAALAAYVATHQNDRFDVAAPRLTAASDSVTLARGRYLVEDVVVCASCHGDPSRIADIMTGREVPLSGGHAWRIPPGTFYAPNITSDRSTGVGGVPTALLARALRYGVRHDGRPLLPFMELQNLSDADLAAVISYVRALPAVRNEVPPHRPNLLGRVVLATVLDRPVGPRARPPVESPTGPTVENGRYLVEAVALCGGCHTARDLRTGKLIGPALAGARAQIEDPIVPGRLWSPPNITSAPRTGRLAPLTEDQFVARFRAGRLVAGSPMPWENLRRMQEDDLRAIYRYLKTVPPVENDPGPAFVDAKP